MNPSKRKRRDPAFAVAATGAKLAPKTSDPWRVAYFKRHRKDDPAEWSPGQDYLLNQCPTSVYALMASVIAAVAAAPPPSFSGGGYWEAMHADMTGYDEIRKKYRGENYRLFCLLDTDCAKLGPLLTILCGMTKDARTGFSDREYAWVRSLGEEYKSRDPRSVVF